MARAQDRSPTKTRTSIIKPQYAIERLYELTKGRDVYITTEVGQHQMWAAQRFKFEEPNRWMTSGGLGTMGYGLPAAVGVQMAHPDSLVIDIAGEASVQMTMQEMSTAVQYDLPIKIFILNNQYMGMVRQWQELLHGGRYSRYLFGSAARFRQARRSLSCGRHPLRKARRSRRRNSRDDRRATSRCCSIAWSIRTENCFPMIPSGRAHNEMILGDAAESVEEVSDEGKMLV